MKHYTNLTELHRDNLMPPPAMPLFSMYRCNRQCSMGEREFTSDFYMIGFKKLKSGVVLYGRTKYDHESGSMMFFRPRQVIAMKNLEFEEDGFLIFVHEDFLHSHELHQAIKKYRYFDYESNEALHLSAAEERTIWDLFTTMQTEYQNNQDEYSRELILSQLDTMLKYAQRFYRRQFINRKEASGHTVTRFTQELDQYIAAGHLHSLGLPSVTYLAERLHLSPGYLSDVLKQESGKTALEHIHIHLISEAKNRLVSAPTSISEIAYALGFENLPYFSRLFKKETGLTPNAYKKQALSKQQLN